MSKHRAPAHPALRYLASRLVFAGLFFGALAVSPVVTGWIG